MGRHVGHVGALRWLYSRGVQLVASSKQETPLLLACAGGHLAAAQYLHSIGDLPDSVARGKTTPLSSAIQSQRVSIVDWLVNTCGVDAEAAMVSGWAASDCFTSLHVLRAV